MRTKKALITLGGGKTQREYGRWMGVFGLTH